MDDRQKKVSDFISQLYRELPEEFHPEELARIRTITSEFLAGFKFLANQGSFITVFGSSRVQPGTGMYELGERLGTILAENGYSVLTGGGPGNMEAVNKGAQIAGGKSMGINIDIPSEQKANPYALPSITLNHFFVRKVLLLKYSTAFIFMPGGFGTLDELFETLTLVQTSKIAPLPVILMRREFWKGLTEWVEHTLVPEGMISRHDMDLIQFADNEEEAVTIIKRFEHHARHQTRRRDG